MTRRKVLAGAVLAALPMVMEAARSVLGVAPVTVAQWGWLYGLEGYAMRMWDIATIVLCSFFGPMAALACAASGTF